MRQNAPHFGVCGVPVRPKTCAEHVIAGAFGWEGTRESDLIHPDREQ